MEPLNEFAASGADWGRLAVACTLFMLLPLALGALRLLRREIK